MLFAVTVLLGIVVCNQILLYIILGRVIKELKHGKN